jgi:hypothetical protein
MPWKALDEASPDDFCGQTNDATPREGDDEIYGSNGVEE